MSSEPLQFSEAGPQRTRLIYATRSILPSATANAVQSANMAVSFTRNWPEVSVTYRTAIRSACRSAHFTPFGLETPPSCHPIRTFPKAEHFHAYLLAFYRVLRGIDQPAVVYTRSARISCVAVQAGLPCVLELHDPLIPIRTRWLRRLERTHRLPCLVVTTDRLCADVMTEIGLPRERILVAGGAANKAHADLPPASPLSEGSFHVAYAGSALRGKGVAQVIACARALPDFTFHLIGPARRDCRSLGPLPGNLILHGRRSPPEVAQRLKTMDALLLPNQSAVIIRSGADIGAHTSPLKLFEYLAAARPIVASNLPVFKNILEDGRNALLVEPTHIAGFCDALKRLRADTVLAKRLATEARKDFEAAYTWDHRAQRILSFLGAFHLLK